MFLRLKFLNYLLVGGLVILVNIILLKNMIVCNLFISMNQNQLIKFFIFIDYNLNNHEIQF